MWLLIGIWSLLISVLLLVKHKLPSRRQIGVSVLLALAVAAAYLNQSLFSMVENSILTLLASLAVFSTFNRYQDGRLHFLDTRTSKSAAVSLLTGVAAGILLGVLNLLVSGSISGEFSLKLSYFTVALSPAIYEEVGLRTIFYAQCLSALNGKIETQAQKFTVWFMMIIPHVLIHTPDSFINGSIVTGLIAVILFSVLFGLPFAVLQKNGTLPPPCWRTGSWMSSAFVSPGFRFNCRFPNRADGQPPRIVVQYG